MSEQPLIKADGKDDPAFIRGNPWPPADRISSYDDKYTAIKTG